MLALPCCALAYYQHRQRELAPNLRQNRFLCSEVLYSTNSMHGDICREPRWWHHAPRVLEVLPGCAQVNKTAIRIPLFTADAGDLIDQYARAFEKVRAHGTKLAKA